MSEQSRGSIPSLTLAPSGMDRSVTNSIQEIEDKGTVQVVGESVLPGLVP